MRRDVVDAHRILAGAVALDQGRLRMWRVAAGASPWEPASEPARWSGADDCLVYAASTAGLAALEALAHLRPADASRRHRLHAIQIEVDRAEAWWIETSRLGAGWTRRRAMTQEIGAMWSGSGRGIALLVPSALVAGEMNLLIYAAHPRWPSWKANARSYPFRFDPRLLRRKC